MVQKDLAGSRQAQIELAIQEKRILHSLQNGGPILKLSSISKKEDEVKPSVEPQNASDEKEVVPEAPKMCSIHKNLGIACQCHDMIDMIKLTADMSHYLDDLFLHINNLDKKPAAPVNDEDYYINSFLPLVGGGNDDDDDSDEDEDDDNSS